MSEEAPAPAPVEEKKKPKRGIWSLYEPEEGVAKRRSRFCPRCGEGFFMADHEDRHTCGKCHYTEFKESEKPPR